MPTATEVLGRYSQAGFYETTVSKCMVIWIGLGHAALQAPIFYPLHKYLICKVPESLAQGEVWRLVTSRIAFVDTKDAILAALLIYSFRVFERRLGSRKFFSRLLSAFLLSTVIEALITFLAVSTAVTDKMDISGLLSVGLFPAIFPWFVPFLCDVPKLTSSSFGGSFLSAKLLVYVGGLHLLASSKANLVAGFSGVLAGILLRRNVLWCQKWFVVPKMVASLAHRFVGRWMESGPPVQGMMGATLEIQRAQQMEALEQQLMRQQVRFAEGRQRRAHVGQGQFQGFAERLVDDAGIGAGWGPFQIPNVRRDMQQPQQRPPLPPTPPSEENVRLLMDMGFSRERVESALSRSNNDLQLATTVLLQDA